MKPKTNKTYKITTTGTFYDHKTSVIVCVVTMFRMLDRHIINVFFTISLKLDYVSSNIYCATLDFWLILMLPVIPFKELFKACL